MTGEKFMKFGIKHLRVCGFIALLAASSISLTNCGKKNEPNHAPSCPPSQFLVYNVQTGYTCQVAQVSQGGYGGYGAYGNAGGYQQPYGQGYGQGYGQQQGYGNGYSQYGQQNSGGYGALIAPLPACPVANQILVNWNNQGWYCLFSDVIYGGGDSPQGYAPPAMRGGEFCITSYNTSGYGGYGQQGYGGAGYGGGYAQQGINPQGLNCTLPMTCRPSAAVAQPGTVPATGQPGAVPVQAVAPGQPGTCGP
jgi:hypothetical protein